jgi:hypothetical protein
LGTGACRCVGKRHDSACPASFTSIMKRFRWRRTCSASSPWKEGLPYETHRCGDQAVSTR